MVDAAPATPVPAVEPAPAAPRIVHRAASAVADGAANAWSAMVAYAPSINAFLLQIGIPAIAMVIGIVTGAGGLASYQRATAPKLVIQAADPPKAVPIRVVVEPLDAVKAELALNSAKLDEILKLLNPPKAIVPAVPAKRTKTSAAR